MGGENDETAGAKIVVERRCDDFVNAVLLVEFPVFGNIANDGGAYAGVQEAVVADQVDDKNPDTKGLVTQAMQDIGGKKDADRGIGDDGHPTRCHRPLDERDAHECSENSVCPEIVRIVHGTALERA